jgi:hypothetical protein
MDSKKALDWRASRMRKLAALQRALNRVRNRSPFGRLYEGVESHKKTSRKMVEDKANQW